MEGAHGRTRGSSDHIQQAIRNSSVQRSQASKQVVSQDHWNLSQFFPGLMSLQVSSVQGLRASKPALSKDPKHSTNQGSQGTKPALSKDCKDAKLLNEPCPAIATFYSGSLSKDPKLLSKHGKLSQLFEGWQASMPALSKDGKFLSQLFEGS